MNILAEVKSFSLRIGDSICSLNKTQTHILILITSGGGQGGLNLPLSVSFNPGSRPVLFGSLPFAFFPLQNIAQRCVIFPFFSRFPPPWESCFPPPFLPASRLPVPPTNKYKKGTKTSLNTRLLSPDELFPSIFPAIAIQVRKFMSKFVRRLRRLVAYRGLVARHSMRREKTGDKCCRFVQFAKQS